jgi:TolB-like protein/Flp pilus assembly protein TadD
MAGEEVGNSSETDFHSSGSFARVFISYASQDTGAADQICRSLESQAVACWMAPRDVRPGAQYADAIVRAINEATAVVLVLSGSAMGSSHVAREVERAASKRKPIIPFRLDEAALNPEFEYYLSNSQWIEVPKLGMPAALARLKEAVGQGGVTASPAIASRSDGVAKRTAFLGAVLVALGIAVWVGWHLWSSSHTAAQSSTVAMVDKSIAVLPFVDMSEKKDQEYFGDGMAEEIIDLLAKTPKLRVIGRTSAFQFKGKTQDLRSIGSQLGVAYLLEGSVRKSGDRVRVTAQLIDSRNGSPRWSQTYDRDFSDVLNLQDEIAIKVVRLVQTDASLSEFVSRRTLRSPEAYSAYLQGTYALNRIDQPGLEQAVSDFQRALELDPSFADAATGLGDTYHALGAYGLMPQADAFEKSRLAAQLALKLDPHQQAAHTLLSYIHMTYDWDWSAAERESSLAMTPPSDAGIVTNSILSLIMGRWDDALNGLNVTLAADPLNPQIHFFLGMLQLHRGRLPEAEAALHRTIELSPTYIFAHCNLALVHLARKEPEQALAEVSKEPSDFARMGGFALVYFVLGRKAESDATLGQFIKSYGPYSPSGAAAIYAFRGESDEAFKWLDRAYEQRDTHLTGIKYRTEFDKLREDPRYKVFLKKMNLPEG